MDCKLGVMFAAMFAYLKHLKSHIIPTVCGSQPRISALKYLTKKTRANVEKNVQVKARICRI